MLVAEGLSCLGRCPLQSTTRPASSPTVLGPQRAVGGQSGWRLCAPPWPATPRTVRLGASRCAGGSPASAVGRLPARLCPASGLPSLWNPGIDRGPSRGSFFPGVGLRHWALAGGGELLGSYSPPLYPAERLCPGGQLYSDCASACPPSCSAVGEGREWSCGEECVSGCECPPGLFWDGALCVPAARCPCYRRRRRYEPGDTVRQLCNPWWVRGPGGPLRGGLKGYP